MATYMELQSIATPEAAIDVGITASSKPTGLQGISAPEASINLGTTASGNSKLHQGDYHLVDSSINYHSFFGFHGRGGRQEKALLTTTVRSITVRRRFRDRDVSKRLESFLKTTLGKWIAVLIVVLVLVVTIVPPVVVTINNRKAAAIPKIKPNSQLAVTGWQDPLTNNYRLRLFYQGPDQLLRRSEWASNETWSEPQESSVTHGVGNSTFLAAAVSLETNATYKMVYVDSQSEMRTQNYDDWLNANEQGNPVFFNGLGGVSVSPQSQVASFWPFIVSQNSDDQLQWLYRGEAPAPWTNVTLNVRGSSGSPLAVVPATAEYLDEARIFYRSTDGSLRDTLVYNVTTQTDDDSYIAIDENAAVAAFAVARDETTNLTNTYVLYPDSNSTIQVIWQDDDTGWKGPRTYDAFEKADNGSDIACLTLSAWGRTGVPMRISGSYNMSRCYFQVQNLVREVNFNGTSWIVLEDHVPI